MQMPTISERASAKLAPKETPEEQRSIAEQFRIVALQYVDADGAASLMEELKSTHLAKLKTKIIDASGNKKMADNQAERIAKCSDDWDAYVREMVALRNKAHKLKLQLEFLRMLERQEDRQSWMDRSERKMMRSVT